MEANLASRYFKWYCRAYSLQACDYTSICVQLHPRHYHRDISASKFSYLWIYFNCPCEPRPAIPSVVPRRVTFLCQRLNTATSSPADDVHHYVIAQKLLDYIFNKLPVSMHQWEKEKAVLYPVEFPPI
jgi:hypothetical protein